MSRAVKTYLVVLVALLLVGCNAPGSGTTQDTDPHVVVHEARTAYVTAVQVMTDLAKAGIVDLELAERFEAARIVAARVLAAADRAIADGTTVDLTTLRGVMRALQDALSLIAEVDK